MAGKRGKIITRFASLTRRLSIAFVFLFGIAACSGGGGGGGGDSAAGFLSGGDGSSNPTFKIELVLTDKDGNVTTDITSTATATLTVTVTSGKNPATAIVVLANADIGLIVPESGTALTDQNGVATFQIEAGDILGAGTVTVTLDVPVDDDGEEPALETLTFQVGQASLLVGHFEDNTFINGELGITTDTLPAGGTALINIAVVDAESEEIETPVEISLSSDCVLNGLAELPETVTTVNGRATVIYTATGCEGTDAITASLFEGSGQAFGTLSITSPQVGSINFISATPELIALKGTGGAGRQETSEVIFEVVTGSGTPVSGITVQFSLSTEVGGYH